MCKLFLSDLKKSIFFRTTQTMNKPNGLIFPIENNDYKL